MYLCDQVISKGLTTGPAGVTLALKKSESTETIKQSQSITGGGFTFEKVLPGDYVVVASHPTWQFETASLGILCTRITLVASLWYVNRLFNINKNQCLEEIIRYHRKNVTR